MAPAVIAAITASATAAPAIAATPAAASTSTAVRECDIAGQHQAAK
jgi:hypothetical protein